MNTKVCCCGFTKQLIGTYSQILALIRFVLRAFVAKFNFLYCENVNQESETWMMCRQNSTWIIKLCQGWVGKVLNNSKAKFILIWYNLGDGNTSHQLTKWYYYGYIWYDELRNNYIMTVFFVVNLYLPILHESKFWLTCKEQNRLIHRVPRYFFVHFIRKVCRYKVPRLCLQKIMSHLLCCSDQICTVVCFMSVW